jgi:hypothetical protein
MLLCWQEGGIMTAESGLKWVLRFIAVTTIPAFIAAVTPQSWLVFLIHKAEPGMSIGILVTYLARGLMLMYAFVGLECFVFAADIRRYLPLIWIVGVGSSVAALIGLIVLFSTVSAGHRTGFFWVVFGDFTEGFAQGVLVVILLLRIPRGHRYN